MKYILNYIYTSVIYYIASIYIVLWKAWNESAEARVGLIMMAIAWAGFIIILTGNWSEG